MPKDDMRVIVCKLLSYLYGCLKSGVEPSPAKAEEVAGCNAVYWEAVLSDMVSHGYVSAKITREASGNIVLVSGLRITIDGVEYLETNGSMAEARRFLGKSLEVVISAAIQATIALS